MFEDADFRWQEEPDDGEYEFQFDSFESSEEGYHDRVAFLIVDDAEEWPIGDVILPTEDISEIESDDTVGTAIFRGTIEDSELTALTYDPELTEQRLQEIQELSEQVRADSDEAEDR